MSQEDDEVKAMEENGPFIETFTGRRFYLFDKEGYDQIEIVDIAHALSMNCRYNGHCSHFYSVAEHSYLVSYLVPKEFALQGLLHDATEAYLSDMVRPFKREMPLYMQMEDTLYSRIAAKYGLPPVLDKSIKVVDLAICKLEAKYLMKSKGEGWGMDAATLTEEEFGKKTGLVGLPLWSPVDAREKFLERFRELTEDHG